MNNFFLQRARGLTIEFETQNAKIFQLALLAETLGLAILLLI